MATGREDLTWSTEESMSDIIDILNTVGPSTTPKIYNIALTLADTEYSQLIPAGTFKLELRCRTPFEIRFAYETGKVAVPTNPYSTLRPNETIWEDRLNLNNITIYLACSTAGKIAELRVWS